MARRISFNSKDIRNLFFEKCLEVLNLQTWSQLKDFLKIRRNMLSSYRVGKLTLPEDIYIKLASKFKEEDANSFLRDISFLNEGWGRVKAGKITYFKHKNIFDEGRKKAIGSVRKRAHKFNSDILLNAELAYFIGLFIGDGFTNKYGGSYIIQFTGDKREEQFYRAQISSICKRLFNIIPKIKDDRVCNAIRVNLYSLDLFNLITKRFKISAGRKSRTVLIPEEILQSKPKIIKACIRGLYDAEGCVFLDKRTSYKKPYPRIELHMCNIDLLRQVYNLLSDFGVKCGLGQAKENLRVTIWGFDEVEKFVKEVGFSNPKYIEKLKLLKL